METRSVSNLLAKPLPDECLYSLAAHHSRTWFFGTSVGASRVVGSVTRLSRSLVGGLNGIASKFHPKMRITGKRLAMEHTSLPLHVPFLHRCSSDQLVQHACVGGSLQLLLGIAPSRLQAARALRVCPVCVITDRRRCGRSYWHRQHQVPGVLVCPEHRVALAETEVRPEDCFRSRNFVACEEAKMRRPLKINAAELSRICPVVRDIQWLLNHQTQPVGTAILTSYYRALAISAGYREPNGNVSISKLREDIMGHYGAHLLARMNCALTPFRQHDWLACLLRKPRAHQQPLRHLLLINFFGITVGQALTDAHPVAPTSGDSKPHPHRIKRVDRLRRLLPIKRQSWLHAMVTERGSVRERHPTLYCWLWRNDRTWLRQHRKPAQPRNANWEMWNVRDTQLASKILEIAAKIKDQVPLVRASRHRIASVTGHSSWLLRNNPLLPTATATIIRCSESADGFAVRRIIAFRTANGSDAAWRIRVRCGISVKLAQHPIVHAALHNGRYAAAITRVRNSSRDSA